MTDPDSELDGPWTFDRVEATLVEMNDAVTSHAIDETVLNGIYGYHIFAMPGAETPAIGIHKTMHVALDNALQEVCLDAHLIEDNHGEVTPETVQAELEAQLDAFLGPNGLDRAFRQAVAEQLGVESLADQR